MEVKKIIAYGPVIIEKGKLLVTLDDKDPFYKIPGGRSEPGESGVETCMRECREETGLEIEILKELPVIKLGCDPKSGKPANIELHHYEAVLVKKQKKFISYNYNGHQVSWLSIKEIMDDGGHEIAPNIRLLIERGYIKL
jgi:8-oxo-dGTP pyrophosphatase MutT (NUDIX family)